MTDFLLDADDTGPLGHGIVSSAPRGLEHKKSAGNRKQFRAKRELAWGYKVVNAQPIGKWRAHRRPTRRRAASVGE